MKWGGNILAGHHIEHGFSADGVAYFHFTDTFNIPVERAMDALHIYQEFKNRTDDEFLKAHCSAKQELYKKNPIDVFALKKLDDQLQERLEMALPPSRIIERMSSVYYFDESENPYKFDRAHGDKKIKAWREADAEGEIVNADGEKESLDFFLSMPIKDLIPSFDLSNIDFQNYLKIADMMDGIHLQTIYRNLSSVQQNNPLFKQPSFTSISEKTKDLV